MTRKSNTKKICLVWFPKSKKDSGREEWAAAAEVRCMEVTQAMHSLFKIVQKLDLILSCLGKNEMVLNREMILLALDLKGSQCLMCRAYL